MSGRLPEGPRGDVSSDAHDQSQVANLGQGNMHVHFGSSEPWRPGPVRALPRLPDRFTGRDQDRRTILAAIDGDGGRRGSPVVSLWGMGGVGKTALARMIAEDRKREYDHWFFLDLDGFTEDRESLTMEQALESLLTQAGALPLADRARGLSGVDRDVRQRLIGEWRNWTAGRELLLVLDNAASADQIDDLLPASDRCLTITTSRVDLHVGTIRRRLGQLPGPEAADLLRLILGPAKTVDERAVAQIVEFCGWLPLAIKLIANSFVAGEETATEIAAELEEYTDFRGYDDGSVQAAFQVSYDRLDSDEDRHLFKRLGCIPGPDVTSFTAALATGRRMERIRPALRKLTGRSLLEEHGRGVYRFHDLVREFARHDNMHLTQVQADLTDGYLAGSCVSLRIIGRTIQTRDELPPVLPDPVSMPATPETARAWLSAEHSNIVELVRRADHPRIAHLVEAIGPYFRRAGHLQDAEICYGRACRHAEQIGDRLTHAYALNGLGDVARLQDRYDHAQTHYTRAAEIAEQIGDRLTHAYALNGLGDVARLQNRYDHAQTHYTRAAEIAEQVGDRLTHAGALYGMGWTYWQHDQVRFRDCLRRALALYRAVGHDFADTVRRDLDNLR
ncbi:MAG: tetratricopeptide repeat protein [Pseudonocardia sp.]